MYTFRKTRKLCIELVMLGLVSGPAMAGFEWSGIIEDVGTAESIGNAFPQVGLSYIGRPIVAWYSGPSEYVKNPIKVAYIKDGYWQSRGLAGSIDIDSGPLQVAHWNEGIDKAIVGWTSADEERLFLSSSTYSYSSDSWADPGYKKVGKYYNYWGAPPDFRMVGNTGGSVINAVWLQQKKPIGLGPQVLRTSRYVNNRWKPAAELARNVSQFGMTSGWDDVTTVVWVNPGNRKVMSRQFEDGYWSAVKIVSQGPPPGNYFDRHPSVARAGTGLATAVWERETPNGWQVLVSQQSAGGKWSTETVIAEGDDRHGAWPQVAASPQGKMMVIWLEHDSDMYGLNSIKARQSDTPGVWTEESVIAKGLPLLPKLAMDGFGNAIVVWGESIIVDGKSTYAVLSRVATDSHWDQPVTLCKDCMYPSVSAARDITRVVWINFEKAVQSTAGEHVED